MPTLTNLKIPHKVTQKKKHGFLQSLFFMVILLLALFFLLQTSFFNIQTITVHGNKQLAEKDLIKLSGLVPGVNIFKANLSTAEKNIQLNPLIKEVKIKRKFPNQVMVSITEREPIGLVPDKNRFIELDSNGIYLVAVDNINQINYPIITGDKITKGRPGEKVSTEKINAALEILVAIPGEVRGTVAEIHIQNMNQIIVYTLDRYQVRFGGTDKIKEKGKLYQELIKQKDSAEKLEYIDIADVDHPAKKPVMPKIENPSTGNKNETIVNTPVPTPKQGGGLGSIPD